MTVTPVRRRLPWALAIAALAATTTIPAAHAAAPARAGALVATASSRVLAGEAATDGLPTPRPARRALSAKVVAQSVPPVVGPQGRRDLSRDAVVGSCGVRRFITGPKGEEILVADQGGGPRLTPTESVRVLRTAGFGWDVMQVALATMVAESFRCPLTIHNNVDARGKVTSVDYGLWQINTKWHPEYASWNLLDPLVSSRIAKRLYDRSGWAPWHGYDNHDRYMDWARDAIAEAKAAGVE